MQINGVQSYCYCPKTPAFCARFSRKNVDMLIENAKASKPENIPQLYTMLEYLDELPGRELRFETKDYAGQYTLANDYRTRVYLGGIQLGEAKGLRNYFGALFNACVKNEAQAEHLRMPERIFEQQWWNNRHKTAEDIRKFALPDMVKLSPNEMDEL